VREGYARRNDDAAAPAPQKTRGRIVLNPVHKMNQVPRVCPAVQPQPPPEEDGHTGVHTHRHHQVPVPLVQL
jgi:hypothetical protein